jgi:hypothetical protein
MLDDDARKNLSENWIFKQKEFYIPYLFCLHAGCQGAGNLQLIIGLGTQSRIGI